MAGGFGHFYFKLCTKNCNFKNIANLTKLQSWELMPWEKSFTDESFCFSAVFLVTFPRLILTYWILTVLCGTWDESESEAAQSCPTLCDPMDCSLPHFSVHGIFQARVLGWVGISFPRGSSQPRDRTWVYHIVGRCFIREINLRWTQWYRIWEERQLFLGITAFFAVFDKGPLICVLLLKCQMPPLLPLIPWRVLNDLLFGGQLWGDANPQCFPGQSMQGFTGQCPLRCHLGLGQVSVLLRAVCCPAGCLRSHSGEDNRTLGLENLYMSSIILVWFGEEFLARRSRFLPR